MGPPNGCVAMKVGHPGGDPWPVVSPAGLPSLRLLLLIDPPPSGVVPE